MSLSNTAEIEINKYILNNTAPSWAGNADFYIALHTADVGEAGTQTTNEAAYGGYARVAIPRSALGFTATANPAVNAALIQMPVSTLDGGSLTHWSIGVTASGAGAVILKGVLDNPSPSSAGVQPQFPASNITILID